MNSGIRHRLNAGQMRILEKLARRDEADDTPELRIEVPVGEYVDPARFELECKAIFERAPVLAGPSCLLPTPSMFVRTEILGRPILLTRDKAGVARAFMNVCLHRGTILCPSADPQKGNRIVCPYHAWTYALDGTLFGVPREEVFSGFRKSDFNLVSLPLSEAGGLLWIGLRSDPNLDFSEVNGALASDLNGLGLCDMQIYRSKTYALKANWKLLQDTMLDRYHVLRLHRESLAKYFDDTPEISDMVGPHVRAIATRLNFTPEDVHEDFARVRRKTVFAYVFYPAGALVVSPHYVSLCIFRPVSADRTDADFYLMITTPPDDASAEEKLQASFELMDRAFGQEDFWAAELGQQGLSSGALDKFVVGGLENRVKMFRDVLRARVEEYERN